MLVPSSDLGHVGRHGTPEACDTLGTREARPRPVKHAPGSYSSPRRPPRRLISSLPRPPPPAVLHRAAHPARRPAPRRPPYSPEVEEKPGRPCRAVPPCRIRAPRAVPRPELKPVCRHGTARLEPCRAGGGACRAGPMATYSRNRVLLRGLSQLKASSAAYGSRAFFFYLVSLRTWNWKHIDHALGCVL